MFRRFSFFLLCGVLPLASTGQSLRINEVMPRNSASQADEYGTFSDWIEVYNWSSGSVDLDGWGLSDDPEDPFRWTFPGIRLAPGTFLRVFASGRDVKNVIAHQETVVDLGDSFRFFRGVAAPPAGWNSIAFDAATWETGPSGFGFGDEDDATNVGSGDPFNPGPVSVFVRADFNIDRPEDVLGVVLHVDYDDGFVAYLNGVEIARAHVDGNPPAFDRNAAADHEAGIYRGEDPERFDISGFEGVLQAGTNVLALQVHNYQRLSSDLTLIPFLTLQMSAVPAGARGLSDNLVMPTPALHTSFKIDADGEILVLTAADGTVVDRVDVPAVPADLSWGRQPDGADSWYFFTASTPGSANGTPGATAFAAAPTFSRSGGFYDTTVDLSLTTTDTYGVIRYTLDGSIPTDLSPLYRSPLRLEHTTVVRARTYAPGLLPGPDVTRTFFVQEPHPLPVFSLSTDPANFFDFNAGIYVNGPKASGGFPYFGANFWEDWERPVHLELYEAEGTLGFESGAGAQIFGAWSRGYPQKSLALFARSEYGAGAFEYPLFPDLSFDEYQSFVLRNAGQDWTHTLFRDAFVQSLLEGTGVDVQAYRPAFLYINGQFWGIHNIREKLNEHYVAAHHDVDPDEIDLIERDEVVHGDAVAYHALDEYIRNHDLTVDAYYDSLLQKIDVQDFIDYTSLFLYSMNYDWPWNNLKAWRPRTPDGRWRWLPYDFDYAYNRIPRSATTANIFGEIRGQDNVTVRLFYALLRNRRYRDRYVNRFADHLNTRFSTVEALGRIESFADRIRPAIALHADRWRGSHSGPDWQGNAIASVAEWEDHVQTLRDFAIGRPAVIRRHLAAELGLGQGTGTIRLATDPMDGGRLQINTILVDQFPWSGVYFRDVPVTITALPRPGYRFAGWTANGDPAGNPVSLSVSDGMQVTARFERSAVTGSSPIVLNEINYNSAATFNPEDWVELVNTTDTTIDLGGWTFRDSDDTHAFVLPPGVRLESGGYLVLVEDSSSFSESFPTVSNFVGELGFGLSGDGELIRLFDRQGNVVDSLTYGVSSPWPVEPDGTGATLALVDLLADNTDATNWKAGVHHGTPGAANDDSSTPAEPEVTLPESLVLEQNYPNPFRERTSIGFTLPEAGMVVIRVYNGMGQVVATLVDGTLGAGQHVVDFDGDNLASGPYYVRLQAGGSVRTRPVMLVR